MIRVCLVMLMMLALQGCADRSAAPAPSVMRAVTEHGVTIETQVASDELNLAERIWVEDRISWNTGDVPVFEPRDWVETEWTLIDEVHAPLELEDGVYSLQRRSLIEPFLPGSYTIPALAVRVTLGEQIEPTRITTEPIEIEVVGVLPEHDAGELNPIPDVTRPIAKDENNTPTFFIAGIAFTAVTLCIVLLILRRNTDIDLERSVLEELREIQSADDLSSRDGFERLGRVFDRMDARLRSTTEFDQMIRVCDQARYSNSPEPSVRVSAQKMAGHALELLGDHPSSLKDGGRA